MARRSGATSDPEARAAISDWDLQFGRGDAVDIDTEICVPTLVYKKPTLFHLVTDSPSSFKLYDFRLTTPSP